MEIFAYGIFIFLSGGFASPYITYYLGCVLISLDQKNNYVFSVLTVFWCIVCCLFGESVSHHEQIKINIMVGVIIVIVGFAVLRYYLGILQEREKELEQLNERLKQENRRREKALLQMSDMYEGFGLIAMTDREQMVGELALLITNNVSPNGCMFVERDIDGTISKEFISKIDDNSAREILKEVIEEYKISILSHKEPYQFIKLKILEFLLQSKDYKRFVLTLYQKCYIK